MRKFFVAENSFDILPALKDGGMSTLVYEKRNSLAVRH